MVVGGGGCFVVEMEGDGWEVAVGWRIDGREGGGRCRSRSWRRTEIGESVEVESVQQGDWVGLQGKRLPQNTGLSLKRWLTCGSLWEVCGRGRVRDERCRQEISEPSRARMPRAEANPRRI